ncbi:YesL family protein [Salimicrobium flavidum]|uniref:Uncharacterized membrane protein YesL n=1 Tax=Salimicrobium flavidum TaxID=570947 RepID=A0A1N7IU79_9BACI|nr:DUF624 domain-containing protein [Salimicrobium flavidum]SIS40642.1 Uncharacterized membrane protein YesL [Salimicrobium flavidum]
MGKRAGVMDGMYAVSEWIAKFSLTNLAWFGMNLPIVLLALSLLDAGNSGEVMVLLVPIILLTPFVFFPATTALFAKAREWVRRDFMGETKSYWRYYKENYRQSAYGGLVFTLLWTIVALDIYYFLETNTLMVGIFLVTAIVLYVFTVNFFSTIVHVALPFRKLMKRSFVITLGSPLLFGTIAVTSGFLLMISVYMFPVIIPVFTGSLVAFLSFSAYFRFILAVKNEEE